MTFYQTLLIVVFPCMCIVSGVIGFLGGHRMGAEDEKKQIREILAMHERQWKREHSRLVKFNDDTEAVRRKYGDD